MTLNERALYKISCVIWEFFLSFEKYFSFIKEGKDRINENEITLRSELNDDVLGQFASSFYNTFLGVLHLYDES